MSRKERPAAIEQFAAVDCEASSLSKSSWPIEVGLAWIEDGRLLTWSSLIGPAGEWDLDDWSPNSARVHGLALTDLTGAPPAALVADEFLKTLAGRIPVSDAPALDTHWISRLIAELGNDRTFAVKDFHEVSFAIYDGLALDMLYEYLERRSAPHRAGPDSERLARAWLRATHFIDPMNEGEDALYSLSSEITPRLPGNT